MIFFENIKKFIKHNWILVAVIIFYALTSTAPLFWFRKLSFLYQYIGRGDYLSPINIQNIVYKEFFTISQDMAGVQNAINFGHLFPFNIIFLIFNYLKINSIRSTLLLISIIIFVSQISFLYSLSYFLRKGSKLFSRESQLAMIISGILYGYSPFLLSLIAPGHIFLLFNYAVFPLIIAFTNKFIDEKSTNPKLLIIIFLLFLFSATSFANFAIIYLNLFILSLYVLLKIIIDGKPIIRTVYKLITIGLILFLSNSWWLVSYLFEIFSNNVIPAISSANVIKDYISNTPSPSYVNLLLLGKTTFNYVVQESETIFNILNIVSMFFIWLLLFKFIFSKTFRTKKVYLIFLVLLIIILFLTKGFSYPFPEIFNFLFYKVPGFVSFRNYHNKFYWFFWYCLLFLSISGLIELLENAKNKILSSSIFFILSCISIFYIFVFIKHPQLGPFNIPSYYNQVNKYLISKGNTSRILLLPPIQGAYAPFFGSDSNYYHGINFIPYIINFPFISLASELTQSESLANRISRNITKNRPICEYLKKLNISDILVLRDINQNVQSLKSIDESVNNMKKMSEFSHYKMFKETNQNGVYLFEVNKNCIGDFVSLDDNRNNSILYKSINPVTIQADIHLQNSANLQLLTNFSNNWALLGQRYNEEKINYIDLLFFKKILKTKNTEPLYNYANSWHLNRDFIIRSFGSEYYKLNHDGSIDFKLIIYYKSQSYQYFGLILFSVFSILSVCYLLLFNKLKK